MKMRLLFYAIDLSISGWLSAVGSFMNVRTSNRVFRLFTHQGKEVLFMQLLTHIIFVLNLLKTLINHFS